MLLRHPAAMTGDAAPLELADVPAPTPGEGEVLVSVDVCGVCRTDLDIVEGRITPPEYPVIPGHQVVGRVSRVGASVSDLRVGDRVGVAWIHWACGVCRYCRTKRENLCPRFVSTGCVAAGGYAEAITVPASFAVALPGGNHRRRARATALRGSDRMAFAPTHRTA